MDALRAARPLTIGDITIIAIERFGIQSDRGDAGFWLSGFKEVYAVVVCDTSGIRVLDTASADIELDELVQQIPELGPLLSRFSLS
jgi:hypothetical protein